MMNVIANFIKGGLFLTQYYNPRGGKIAKNRHPWERISDYRSDDNEWKLGHSEAACAGVNFINMFKRSF